MLMTKLKITFSGGAGAKSYRCRRRSGLLPDGREAGSRAREQPVTAQKQQPTEKAEATTPLEAGPWGEPVDGIACRLTMQPRYVIGQAISAVIEVKNTSNKKRYVILYLDPYQIDTLTLDVTGPQGKLAQRFQSGRANRDRCAVSLGIQTNRTGRGQTIRSA